MNERIMLQVGLLLLLGCSGPPDMDEALGQAAFSALALMSEGCLGEDCPDKSDTRLASGRGTAINAGRAGAIAQGKANAEKDAKLKAAKKLDIPDCDTGCQPFGEPGITYNVLTSSCTNVGQSTDWPDTNGDGIGDWWEWACGLMRRRNMQDRCDDPAVATAKPWYAVCFANASATGVQLCIDAQCTCGVMGYDGDAMCTEAIASGLAY